MKTARFVLSCHSVGTSLPEIALSARMSASSFAGSPRCAFTVTRNVAAPAVVLFGALRLLLVKCLRLALLLTSLFRLHLPIFLQLSAGLGCRTNTAWVLSQGCRVMPRQNFYFPFFWVFFGAEERREEGRGGGKGGREGGGGEKGEIACPDHE